jgi:N-acetylneuraminate synthase
MTITSQHGVFIIAEAGVNHNGSVEMARQLIDVAAEAGADAVKFQTFRAAALASAHAPKATYQTVTTDRQESQVDMLRRLELPEAAYFELAEHARRRGIGFLSTPFDEVSLAFLTGPMGLTTIKVPSGEITNGPLLLAVARSARQVIVSTGMSNLAEVEAALAVIAFGFVAGADLPPGLQAFQRAYASTQGKAALQQRVTLLHCTSEYPAPVDQVNLNAMNTLRVAFDVPVGYSDHTVGIHVSVAAAALGATVIEKHFTLDRSLPGPDHLASLEPAELRQLVSSVRDVHAALGHGRKLVAECELNTRDVARKSLVAAVPVAAGEVWRPEMLTAKRPGTGVSPMQWWSTVGTRAVRSYGPEEMLP